MFSELCGFSSFGRARPCQGRGGGFEPRNPLHAFAVMCVPRIDLKVNATFPQDDVPALFGGLAQLGEHLPYKQRVTGSSPVPPTILCSTVR